MADNSNVTPGTGEAVRSKQLTSDSSKVQVFAQSLLGGSAGAWVELVEKFAVINHAASGDVTVVAGVASKKIRVLRWSVVCASAVNLRWYSGASPTTPLSGLMNFTATVTAGISENYCPVGIFETASGAALVLNLSAAVQVGGSLTYVEI